MKSCLPLLILAAASGPALAQPEVLVEQGSSMRWLASPGDPGLGLAWTDPDFADAAWSTGSYGIGYETGTGALALIDTPVPTDTLTVYTRAEFDVADPAAVINLLLAADWDDGWAAWINGLEVYRSPEMPAGPLDWNSWPSLHESSNAATPVYSPEIDLTALARPALRAGRNVLAVAVWNANLGSSDLVLVPRLRRDVPTEIVRGPYLQLARSDAVVVRWRTSSPVASRLWHGPPSNPTAVRVEDPVLRLDHALELRGLSPGVTRVYRVERGVEHEFRTPPPPGTRATLRAWVIGDSGTGNSDAVAVRDAYRALHGPLETDTWLLLGDNAYDDGTDAEYQIGFFNVYGAMMASVAAWPTLGNHDGRSADSIDESGVYYDIFTLPRAAEAGGLPSGTEAYYSFDQANVHFVCLDSFESDRLAGGDMLTWLEADLAATRQEWIIAFWHHPPYSKGSHDSDLEVELIDMRENAVPLLEAAGVDLVLSGHSHSYERSVLIDGHELDSSTFGPAVTVDGGDGDPGGDGEYAKPTPGLFPNEGAVYAVAGSSGKTSPAPLDHPAMIVNLEELGSMVLEVRGLRLDARFIDSTGAVRDAFTIVKGCAAPPCFESDCGNGLDDDGDGAIDADDPDCRPADTDGDGVEDELDCAPADPGVWALPGSIRPLLVSSPDARLAWTDAAAISGPDTLHDVAGGLLSELRADFGFARASCVAGGVAGSGFVHVAPSPGDGRWYLVRATNACGRSGWGDDSFAARGLIPDPCP